MYNVSEYPKFLLDFSVFICVLTFSLFIRRYSIQYISRQEIWMEQNGQSLIFTNEFILVEPDNQCYME